MARGPLLKKPQLLVMVSLQTMLFSKTAGATKAKEIKDKTAGEEVGVNKSGMVTEGSLVIGVCLANGVCLVVGGLPSSWGFVW